MPSAGRRERVLRSSIEKPKLANSATKSYDQKTDTVQLPDGIQLTESVSNRFDRKVGHYNSGGPFYTSRTSWFVSPGRAEAIGMQSGGNFFYYSGPYWPTFPSYGGELFEAGFTGKLGDKNESPMKAKGPTAISLTSPTNKTADLATNLAETMKEGLPSLYGMQTWKRRTADAKSAGAEYLNHQFGWAPLVSEIKNVANAARHHRDIMSQYQNGEGRDTHRRFDFPSSSSRSSFSNGAAYALEGPGHPNFISNAIPAAERRVTRVRESRCWFEGCYTYGGPGKADNFTRHLGYGSNADHLLGLSLTPDTVWELTPWSWAIDWFSNAGDVINNVTNFGLAGLVMRYGYIMEESIDKVTVEIPYTMFNKVKRQSPLEYEPVKCGPASCGVETVTKRRVAASPFGFSVGWEGLSPTQLAITAALGITKWL